MVLNTNDGNFISDDIDYNKS